MWSREEASPSDGVYATSQPISKRRGFAGRRLHQVAARAWLAGIAIYVLCSHVQAELAIDVCAHDSPSVRRAARETVREMFYHGYNNYKLHALPRDELRPISCGSADTFGGIAVTLVDTLDALAVLGDWEEFVWAVQYVEKNIQSFDLPTNVSVFEANIRVLGGLLSAHGILTNASAPAGFDKESWYPDYSGGLLKLAIDLAERLMPAFETATGIPYGAVGLQRGVWPSETTVASTAAAGGLLVEFGMLSAMSGDPRYYEAAFGAMQALFERRADTDLVGNHIDTATGEWVAHESSIGALVDSFFEYMVKGYILFGDVRLMDMFWTLYSGINRYLKKGPWYLPADMFSGLTTSSAHCSLGAFWPGLQVLIGDIEDAIKTTRAHFAVWRRYGCLPEGYNVLLAQPAGGQVNYPLRPELLESAFLLHWATNDTSWVGVGLSMMHSLQALTKVQCGFARIDKVNVHSLEDMQDSFFLSETLKYMYIMFDDDHWLRKGGFVFSTEAHPFLIPTDSVPGAERPDGIHSRSRRPADGREARERVSRIHKPGVLRAGGSDGLKCPRRGAVERKSACGFGMPGTDVAQMTMDDVRADPIADDVMHMVRQRLAPEDGTVALGEVFLGADSAYRVARITSTQVFMTQLESKEEQSVRQEQLRKQLARVADILWAEHWHDRRSREATSPYISFPKALWAPHVWTMLHTCYAWDPPDNAP